MSYTRRFWTAPVYAAALLSSGNTNAAVTCEGPVYSVSIEPDGGVWTHYGYGWHRVCFLNRDWSVYRTPSGNPVTVNPETCAGLMSSLMTSKSTGRKIKPSFNRDDCNIGNWVDPNPAPYFWDFPQ